MSTLCVISARGGSKGVPCKNIRPISGKPLIAWSIEQAQSSSLIDHVVVSTDNDEMSDVSTNETNFLIFLKSMAIYYKRNIFSAN